MSRGIPLLLLAEDDADDRDFFCAGMRRIFPNVIARTFENGDTLLNYLHQCTTPELPRCMLLDYRMHPHHAPEILAATGAGTRYDLIPKIVWSTSQQHKDMDECVRLGAARFVVKPETDDQLDNLLRLFSRWLD